LFEQLKKEWKIIRETPPGRRFQRRYEYRRYSSSSSAGWDLFKFILGIILIPLGMLLWFLPGPGWLVIFVGLALLAGRSGYLSGLLDRVDAGVRKIFSRSGSDRTSE